MAGFVAMDGGGWRFLPAGSYGAEALERESLGRPCHWWAAYPVTTGGGTTVTTGAGTALHWASFQAGDEGWRVRVYPEGGAGADQWVPGVGWVVADEEIAFQDGLFEALQAAAVHDLEYVTDDIERPDGSTPADCSGCEGGTGPLCEPCADEWPNAPGAGGSFGDAPDTCGMEGSETDVAGGL